MSVIAVVATLDTKGAEAYFIRDTIRAEGHETLVIDTSPLGSPYRDSDVCNVDLYKKAGIDDYLKEKPKGKKALVDAIKQGLAKTLVELVEEGKIDGVISAGGAQGTAISTYAMQQLPIAFPKVMISTVACGTAQFGDYVGAKDIVMIPSLCDVCGINALTAPIFRSGCGAVIGMVNLHGSYKSSHKGTIVLTMIGMTTPCVMEVKRLLEEKDYDTIVLHSNGVGSLIADDFAAQRKLTAVMDISPHELSGELFDGLMKCPGNRFEKIYESGLPIIMTPASMDIILSSPGEGMRPELRNRPHYEHTPFHTHVRTSYEDMYKAGEFVADKLNNAKGKATVVVPGGGYSTNNKKGGPIYDEHANSGFVKGLEASKEEKVNLVMSDYHVNDPGFAALLVQQLEAILTD